MAGRAEMGDESLSNSPAASTPCSRDSQGRQEGFVIILLLGALPVLLSLAMGASLLAFHLKPYYQYQRTCRILTLHAQSELAQLLKELLRLNPEAKRLRAELIATQKALRAAQASGQVQWIALAQTRLAQIKMQQMRLQAQQRGYLRRAQSEIAKLSEALIRRLPNAKLRDAPSGLALRVNPATSLTPDYLPAVDFREHQKLEVTWQQGTPWPIQGRCGASLELHKRSWWPVLAAAKF